jgi:hypothetical protein
MAVTVDVQELCLAPPPNSGTVFSGIFLLLCPERSVLSSALKRDELTCMHSSSRRIAGSLPLAIADLPHCLC